MKDIFSSRHIPKVVRAQFYERALEIQYFYLFFADLVFFVFFPLRIKQVMLSNRKSLTYKLVSFDYFNRLLFKITLKLYFRITKIT